MAKYLLIEPRDPFASHDVSQFYRLAVALARSRNKVTVLLVEDGVLPARPDAETHVLDELRAAGVEILADDTSLRARGICAERLAPAVKTAEADAVVVRFTDGGKTIWH
jgi:intracellular sulfur oxidation DsrE/DsrF family protein